MEGVATISTWKCHKLPQRKQPDGVDWLVLEKSERGCRVDRNGGRLFLLWGTCGGLSRLLLCISRYRDVPRRSKTRKLSSFCILIRYTNVYRPSCCNQRGFAAALRVGTLCSDRHSNVVEEVLALSVTSETF